uniref:Thioredoxin domain-containing protein n=1 Tax=Panagrolaimus sp. ES5 TaxID=591445 RepID=A0AC34GUM8_9BILA
MPVSEITSASEEIAESIVPNIPGETVEKFVENFVQSELEEAIKEASTNLFIEKCFEEEKEKATDDNSLNEKYFTEDSPIIVEDFDDKTFIEKIKYLIRESDYFLNRYMWIIAIIWLLIVTCRWFGSANILIKNSRATKAKMMKDDFRSSDGKLLTRPAPPPLPFFPNYTRGIIDDLYYGNGAMPSELLQKSEISILMFYAPWSLHSQEAKKPFTEVATAFSFMPTVRFSAVNCFTKFGSCKRQFKLYSFPIIVGYVGKVQINYPGVPSTVGLFRFVKHLIDPADKVSSMSELNKMFVEFEHLVVGYFPFKDNQPPPEYTTFIATAMKSAGFPELLESTRFIIIQNPSLAAELSLDNFNRIKILTRNRIETPESKFNISSPFFLSKHTKSDDIIEWIKEKISQNSEQAIVEWLYLDMLESGGKSEILYSAISEFNAAILFTTDYGSNIAESDSLKIIRDAAKAYHSCNGTATVSHPKSDSKKIEEAQNGCRRMALDPEQILPCCQHLIKAGICLKSNSSMDLSHEDEYCSAVLKVIPIEAVQKRCCFSPRSPSKTKSLFHVSWEDQISCEWYRLMKKTENFPQIKNPRNSGADFSSIQGLGCASNETVKFFAACRKHNHHLLKQLNFDNETKSINDKLVIISVDRESSHLLDHEINAEQISKFLIDFHARKLNTIKMLKKIDASANDLPFQYRFDRLPAIVFIPPLSSSIGGARYPHNLPISVPNLLAFLLSRSQPELRWRIALSSCSIECIKRNRLELHRFLSLLDLSIRKYRTIRSHLIRGGHGHDASIQAAFVRTALHRRILQRTAAVHLDNVLQLLASNDNLKNVGSNEANQIIKQSLFIRWILYNHFGL